MGDKWNKFEAYAELKADGYLQKVIAWRRTAVIVGGVLFLTHLAAYVAGRLG
jgi:hypothetical protein